MVKSAALNLATGAFVELAATVAEASVLLPDAAPSTGGVVVFAPVVWFCWLVAAVR